MKLPGSWLSEHLPRRKKVSIVQERHFRNWRKEVRGPAKIEASFSEMPGREADCNET